jgi:hypothetical protein
MPANSFLDAPRAYLFFNPTFLKYFDCIFTSKKINMIFNGYISTDIFQRIYFNGYIFNGYIFNGYIFNGYIFNGYIFNGYIFNGYIFNGYIFNGYMDI